MFCFLPTSPVITAPISSVKEYIWVTDAGSISLSYIKKKKVFNNKK